MPEATASFDPVNAIQNRLAELGEDKGFKRLQEEAKGKLNLGDPKVTFALRQIEMAEKALESGPDDFEYTRLAEGYYLIAQFEKAYELTRDPAKKKEYAELMDAPSTFCSCPSKNKLDPRFLMDKLGGKAVWKCSNCLQVFVC